MPEHLSRIAPEFVAMAHSIVWATVATTDVEGRARTRILHPIWEWDGHELTGWIATNPTSPKRSHVDAHPFVACTYWTPAGDTCTAECRAEWGLDTDTRRQVWKRFVGAPAPVGYDPGTIPGWDDPSSPAFGVLVLHPWRLRVLSASSPSEVHFWRDAGIVTVSRSGRSRRLGRAGSGQGDLVPLRARRLRLSRSPAAAGALSAFLMASSVVVAAPTGAADTAARPATAERVAAEVVSTEAAAAEARPPIAAVVATPSGDGYWLVDRQGGVSAFGDAPPLGPTTPPSALAAPVVAAAAAPSGQGLWLAASDGGVFTLGDVPFLGSLGGVALRRPVVAITATPSGRGYWLVASDGGVFTFGDAGFLGSTGAIELNRPVVGGLATPSGRGYWLVASDGGVFAFGDAPFVGSLGATVLNRPVVAITASGPGYRMVAADGGIFTFGAPFFGAEPGRVGTVAGMAARSLGDGYWVAGEQGAVQAFGAAAPLGTLPPGPLSGVALRTETITDRLVAPTAIATRPGDDALYVTERAGVVRAVRGGLVDPVPVLALPAGLVSSGGERGLLGLAFSADGDHLFVDHTLADGDIAVAEYPLGPDGRADPAGRRALLRIEHSAFNNHNGGDLHVGPDGYLYVTVGDGGGAGDPLGRGQDLASLLGKVLRIDPSAPSAGRPYAIPPTNPFVARAGAAPEVWAWGLRNPWRIAFDRATRDLWIADVGQSQREEIDLEPAGSAGGHNYGWPRIEGTLPYDGEPVPGDAVAPLHEYPHSGGDISITGGRVYRGAAIPALVGAYVFGDFGSGRVGLLRQRDGAVVDFVARALTLPQVVAFGEDPHGELVAATLNGRLVRFVA